MSNPSPLAAAPVALAEQDQPRRDLLVIASDPEVAQLALSLDFRQAHVLHAGSDWDVEQLAREVGLDTSYDVVVVDGPSFTLARRVSIASRARQVLRPGGVVVVLVEPGAVPEADAALAAQVRGLEWESVGVIDGRPCMVFTPTTWPDTPSPNASARIATMAATLAAVGASDGDDRSGDAQYLSESALLAHLRLLAEVLAGERRQRLEAQRRSEEVVKEHRELNKQHGRLRRSKLGKITLRYWRLRRAVGRRLRLRRR